MVGSVCFAHFVSHYYIMLLAPLFLVIRADYGVTYTELGLALTLSNIVSTVFQTPAGFLVDRMSARIVLIVGLLLGAGALAVAGLVNSFWVFVAMFGIVGLGNTVYHPADYSLLSHHVPAERAGRMFSFHTFAGMLGNAAAPATLVYLQQTVGWRGAFLVAASLGLVAALILVWQGEPQTAPARVAREKKSDPQMRRWTDGGLLTATPILLSLLFFILLSFCGGGLSNYLIVGLGALHGTPPEVANTALTSLAGHERRRRIGRRRAHRLDLASWRRRRWRADRDRDRLHANRHRGFQHAHASAAAVGRRLLLRHHDAFTGPDCALGNAAGCLWARLRLRFDWFQYCWDRAADYLRPASRPRLPARTLLCHGKLRAAGDDCRTGDSLVTTADAKT